MQAHARTTQCTRNTNTLHTQCTHNVHAMHNQCTYNAHTMQCTCNAHTMQCTHNAMHMQYTHNAHTLLTQYRQAFKGNPSPEISTGARWHSGVPLPTTILARCGGPSVGSLPRTCTTSTVKRQYTLSAFVLLLFLFVLRVLLFCYCFCLF